MGRTEKLDRHQYADLVRRVVAFVQSRQSEGKVTHWYTIRNRFTLTNNEVNMICGDSTAYGPQLMCHALGEGKPLGETTVEVVG